MEQDEPVETNYALRLTEALEAISAANTPVPIEPSEPTEPTEPIEPIETTYTAVRKPHAARPTAKPVQPVPPAAAPTDPAPAVKPARPAIRAPAPVVDQLVLDELDLQKVRKPRGLASLLAALDRLPPIRLPVGPPIPWRIGLPMLLALVAVMFFFSRPVVQTEPTGVRLPNQETYPVQQDAPLFANSHPETPVPAVPAASKPIGASEPPATTGVDFFDLGLKFVAVLALAYGSLMLLKRLGLGGAANAGGGGPTSAVRVVHSLVLAPNRTVHVLRIPGGKSLLVGATPTQVNLIADLGELDDEALASEGGSSFFDVLAGKLGR
jgi:flagellar biogenesis protein FliO